MINFIVEDLSGLLEILKQEGVEVVGDPTDDEYGKFGWIIDPEGNKIELWEPPKSSKGIRCIQFKKNLNLLC